MPKQVAFKLLKTGILNAKSSFKKMPKFICEIDPWTHLNTDCDADADKEDGNGQLVIDSKSAKDVTKDFFDEK